jgi:hypothetical protein
MEGHFITGFSDGSKSVQEAEPIKLLPSVGDEADRVLDRYPDTVARIERVVRLSEGFESERVSLVPVAAHGPLSRSMPARTVRAG